MISRFYLLVGVIGLALATGVGWGLYELRRERAADAPVANLGRPARDTTPTEPPAAASSPSEPAPPGPAADAVDLPVDDARAGAPPVPPNPAADAVGPRAGDARAEAPPVPPGSNEELPALAAAHATPAAPPAPQPRETTARSRPAPPAGQAPPASIPSDEPVGGTGAQADALSSTTEAEAPALASAPSSPAEAAPSAALDVAEAEPAPPPVEAAQEKMARRADPVGAEAEAPAAIKQAVERPASSATPAPGAIDRPDQRQAVASAAPAGEAAEAADPSSSEEDRSAERAGSAALETGVPQESRPAAARAAETIKRALSALFGGAADAPAPEPRRDEPAAPGPKSAAPDQVAATDRGDRAGVAPGAGPTFDIVRIAPGGRAVIAGRAAPDAEVEIRSGDHVIDRVRADRRGEWVATPPEPLPAGDQELTLLARSKERPAAVSDEVLVVAVPEPPPPQPAPSASGEPPPPQPSEVATADSPSASLAMALPRDGRRQGRILQAPGRLSSDGTLALTVLDYDETGRIRLRGEAPPGSPLRIYVDNAPAGAAVVEPSGQWSTVLAPSLAPGDYTLRLDQLDPAGKPTARLETPFTRASQPPVEGDVQVDFVIVQPGNSLWRIARRLYGHGLHYVHIYDANDAQIRDPDLIYPGQVFEIPSNIGAAG